MYVWINRYIHKQGRYIYMWCVTTTAPLPTGHMCVDTHVWGEASGVGGGQTTNEFTLM